MVTQEELLEYLRSAGLTSNEMLRNGLKSGRTKETPFLLKRHRDAKLKFVRQHKEKENSFWERVLWTDEIKIVTLAKIRELILSTTLT